MDSLTNSIPRLEELPIISAKGNAPKSIVEGLLPGRLVMSIILLLICFLVSIELANFLNIPSAP